MGDQKSTLCQPGSPASQPAMNDVGVVPSGAVTASPVTPWFGAGAALGGVLAGALGGAPAGVLGGADLGHAAQPSQAMMVAMRDIARGYRQACVTVAVQGRAGRAAIRGSAAVARRPRPSGERALR
jgi:hypothetical protein